LASGSFGLAAEEPCYGYSFEDRVSGDHLHVEWAPDVITRDEAEALLFRMEDAWGIYVDALGWRAPPPAVSVLVEEALVPGSVSGVAQTRECEDGSHLPRLQVFAGAFKRGDEMTTGPHELGHALEYAYMGSYLDGLEAWAWWMEGTATWFERYVDGEGELSTTSSWVRSMRNYTGAAHLALHHDFLDINDHQMGGHMYGTAVLAMYIDEYYGADVVRQTWETGANHVGEGPLWFPDVIAEMGLDFDTFWQGYIAAVGTLDFDDAELISDLPRATAVSSLPDSGSPKEKRWPQGLGLSYLRVNKSLGSPGATLRLIFDGDPKVKWHVVSFLAKQDKAGAKVKELTALDVDHEGHAEIELPFDGDRFVYLAVSPEAPGKEGFEWSWAADLADRGEEASSGACASAPVGVGWWWLAMGPWWALRRYRGSPVAISTSAHIAPRRSPRA